MPLRRFAALLLTASIAACVQVPKESVELSTTVGRDLTNVHRSHRELAKVLFGRMRQDVNRFVDNVYAPYQIRAAMENDLKNAKSADAKDRQASLLLAVNNAFKPDASDQLQSQVLQAMGFMVKAIHDDVESMRRELTEPLNQQEARVLGAIDRNYSQIIYANSIVTGYLASVVKVHDAQNELLRAIGEEGDLSKLIGEKLAAASEKVGNVVNKAETVQASADNIQRNVSTLKGIISGK